MTDSSVVKLGLRNRGMGGFRYPNSWSSPLQFLDSLCVSAGVEVDVTGVELTPKKSGSAYSQTEWVELISSALVAASVSTAYCRDDRAVLQDAIVCRDVPEVTISFRNMTAELLRESRKAQRKKRKGPRDFGEGHAKVTYLASIDANDLENMFRVSSLLSFFSCATSLFIECAVRRLPDQEAEGVLLGTIEAISDVVEKFYFG